MDNKEELLGMFVAEVREHLDQFKADVVALEGNQEDVDLINRLFRAAHSIKGASSFFALEKITQLSHSMENILAKLREGVMNVVPYDGERELTLSTDLIDALLKGAERLDVMVGNVAESDNVDIAPALLLLETFLSSTTSDEAGGDGDEPPPSPAQLAVTDNELQRIHRLGHHLYAVTLRPSSDCAAQGGTAADYFRKIDRMGRVVGDRQAVDAACNEETGPADDASITFGFATILDPDLAPEGLGLPAERVRVVPLHAEAGPAEPPTTIDPSSPPPPSTSPSPTAPAIPAARDVPGDARAGSTDLTVSQGGAPAVANKSGGGTYADETIRVSVRLLDELMTLAGEIVLARNRLLNVSSAISRDVKELPPVLQQINLITSQLQEKVMRTRLLPLENIFTKFIWIVRNMSSELSKETHLEMTGMDVELDKSIIEGLTDPLTHLIRNCVDHGIEPPDERERLGKPRIGTVRLAASQEGGQVLIEVSDDGRGLDRKKIIAKAIDKGLIQEDTPMDPASDECLQLIFRPGFSTAEQLSNISGRGVGMDVVKTNIEHLGGGVELHSTTGQGTRFVLRVPLTLAIVPAMIVTVGDHRFSLPQVNLEEVIGLDSEDDIEQVYEMDVLRLRSRLLPLVHLRDVLEIKAPEGAEPSGRTNIGPGDDMFDSSQRPKQRNGYVLVLKSDENRFGLVVDELLDTEEIVVKPLTRYLKRCKCYAGSTIMGDGKLAMILDTPGLAELASLDFDAFRTQETAERIRTAAAQVDETQSILLFRNAPDEHFALPLAMVARIEQVRTADIKRIGNDEFVTYPDGSMRIMRLHEHISVTPAGADPEWLHIVVPKLVRTPIGIVATQVDDVAEVSATLDRDSLSSVGIEGTAIVNGHLTIFLNMYALLEIVDPQLYSWNQSAPMLAGKRVLLAEDVEFFRRVELDYLRAFGCTVDVVPNGTEAWEMLKKHEYDMVLTDIEMPEMDGFELTHRIRTSTRLKELPVVALTALSNEQHVARGNEVGVDAYEIKLDKEQLRNTLEDVLAKHRRTPDD